MPKSNKRLSQKRVFLKTQYTKVVDLVDGKRITNTFRKGTTSSVSIIPILDKNTILLVKQYRPAVRFNTGRKDDGWIYEIPGGKIEAGETIQQAAKRELEEEVGYVAGRISFLYSRYLSPWSYDGIDNLVVATKLHKVDKKLEEDEMIVTVPLKRAKILALLKSGKIKDITTRDGLLYWLTLKKKS